MANYKASKFGIFDFGFIKNSGSFIRDLNNHLTDTGYVAEFDRFNKHFYKTVTQEGQVKYLSKYGYEKEKGETPLEESRHITRYMILDIRINQAMSFLASFQGTTRLEVLKEFNSLQRLR